MVVRTHDEIAEMIYGQLELDLFHLGGYFSFSSFAVYRQPILFETALKGSSRRLLPRSHHTSGRDGIQQR